MQSIQTLNPNAAQEYLYVLELKETDSVSLQDLIYYDYTFKSIKHKLQICLWSDRKDIRTIFKDCYDNIIVMDSGKNYVLLLEQPELPEYFKIIEKEEGRICYKVRALPYNHPKIIHYINPNGSCYVQTKDGLEKETMPRVECEWGKIEIYKSKVDEHGDKVIHNFDTYKYYYQKDKCKKSIQYFKKKYLR